MHTHDHDLEVRQRVVTTTPGQIVKNKGQILVSILFPAEIRVELV